MTAREFNRIARLCLEKAKDASDEDGFVSLYKLATNLGANITLRPLLVEAMLASNEGEENAVVPIIPKWHILLNEEKFRFKEWELINENRHSPLPSRARNTIAHELVHLILVRAYGEKAEEQNKGANRHSAEAIINEIENDVEKLSPLLLLPGTTLDKLLESNKPSISITDLVDFRKQFAVSRELVINRIRNFGALDDFIHRRCLQNIAIGIGRWEDDGRPVLQKRPLFSQFQNNHHPEFVNKLLSNDFTEIDRQFTDENFFLNYGNDLSSTAEVNAGTIQNPKVKKMRVELSVERSSKENDSKFFFIVREMASDGRSTTKA